MVDYTSKITDKQLFLFALGIIALPSGFHFYTQSIGLYNMLHAVYGNQVLKALATQFAPSWTIRYDHAVWGVYGGIALMSLGAVSIILGCIPLLRKLM